MGCDVGTVKPLGHVEREQKFLVDLAAFERVKATARRQRVRQCYVALGGDAGWEVRFREAVGDAIDLGACDTCRKKPGRCWNCSFGIAEHPCHHCDGKGRRVAPRTITYIQTLKRHRPGSSVDRDEVEWAISSEVFDTVWAASAWRVEKDRYTLGDWTVDVFTSGPLRGVVVAEMELPEEYEGGASEWLSSHGRRWPTWLPTGRLSDYAHATIDLTAERVNLVACGAVEASVRLRRILSTTSTATTALSVTSSSSFPTRPATPKLTRQGVRDLGYSKRGGVL